MHREFVWSTGQADLESQLFNDAAGLLQQCAQPLVLGVGSQLEVLLIVVLLQSCNASILLPCDLVPLPAPTCPMSCLSKVAQCFPNCPLSCPSTCPSSCSSCCSVLPIHLHWCRWVAGLLSEMMHWQLDDCAREHAPSFD